MAYAPPISRPGPYRFTRSGRRPCMWRTPRSARASRAGRALGALEEPRAACLVRRDAACMLGGLRLAGAASPGPAQYAARPSIVPPAIYGALYGGADLVPLAGGAWAVLPQAASFAAFWSPVAYCPVDMWGMPRCRRPAVVRAGPCQDGPVRRALRRPVLLYRAGPARPRACRYVPGPAGGSGCAPPGRHPPDGGSPGPPRPVLHSFI